MENGRNKQLTKEEKNAKHEIVIEMTKNLELVGKIAEETGYSKANISIIMKKEGIYTRTKVAKLIKAGKTNEQIAKEGNVYTEAVERFRKESEKQQIVIEMTKNLEPVQKIMEATGYSRAFISIIMKKEGIYTRTKVAELIKAGKTNEEIAKEGNVYAEAVDSLRKRIENGQSLRKKSENHEIVIEMAKNLEPVEKIVEVTGYTRLFIYTIMKQEGIYTRTKVAELIKLGKTNEEIAKKGNVYAEAVDKLRREIGNVEHKMNPVDNEDEVKKDVKQASSTTKPPKEITVNDMKKLLVEGDLRKEYMMLFEEKNTDKIVTGGLHKQIANIYMQLEEFMLAKKWIDKGVKDGLVGLEKLQQELAKIIKMKRLIEKLNSPNYPNDIALLARDEGLSEIYVRQSLETVKENGGKLSTLIIGNGQGITFIPIIPKTTQSSRKTLSATQKLAESTSDIEEPKTPSTNVISKEKKTTKPIPDISKQQPAQPFQVPVASEKEKNTRLTPYIREQIIRMLRCEDALSYISAQTRVPISDIKKVQEEFKRAKESNVSPERKAINLKIKMLEIRGMIKAFKDVTGVKTTVIGFKIQSLMEEYRELLEQKDYALFAFAYTKIHEYQKAIEIGEQHLGLEDSRLSALFEKIFEITRKDEQSILQNNTPTEIGTDR